jgi:(p)ppGpp synthase/HD superfamily hydrolase
MARRDDLCTGDRQDPRDLLNQPASATVGHASLAESLARQWHGEQRETSGDKRPYVDHLAAVAELVEGDDVKAIAWLHDILEDTAATERTLFDAGIPFHVIASVIRLTKLTRGDFAYGVYIDSLAASSDAKARAVKIADLLDHLRPSCPDHLRPRYRAALGKLLDAHARSVLALPEAPVAKDGLPQAHGSPGITTSINPNGERAGKPDPS